MERRKLLEISDAKHSFYSCLPSHISENHDMLGESQALGRFSKMDKETFRFGKEHILKYLNG